MKEYHRGFEDCKTIVDELARRHGLHGRKPDVTGFLEDVADVGRAIHDHKTRELLVQMGLA